MRQDHEPTVANALDDTLGNDGRLEDAVDIVTTETLARLVGLVLDADHARGYRLGADDRDADSLVAVRNRHRFCKGNRSVLRSRIRGIPYLAQQPGSGGDVNQPAAAAGTHRGQYRPRRIDVAHDVDLPASLPTIVNCVKPPTARGGGVAVTERNTGVRHEQVNVAEITAHFTDQIDDLGFVTNIGNVGSSVKLRGHGLGGPAIDIADRNCDVFPGQTSANGAADTVPSARDYCRSYVP
jgi:hypothetical protein